VFSSTTSAPYVVVWLITAKCNLSCKHCYAKQYLEVSELSLKEKLKLAEEIGEIGVEWVAISGGEPLIHKDTIPVIEKLRDYGVEVSVSSNATVVNETLARKLSRLDVYVYVSIDGPEKVHDTMRGKGTFRKTIESIKIFKKHSVEYGTVMAIGKPNKNFVREYLELALSIDAGSISIIPIMPTKHRANSEYLLSPKEYARVIKTAEVFAEENKYSISLWCTPFAPLLVKSNYIGYYSCRILDTVDIDPSGRLLACDVTGIPIVDFKNKSLIEALEEYQKHPIIKTITNPPELPKACLECELLNYCRGGCYARALFERGGLNAGDPLCPLISGLNMSEDS